ncbi:hypothetical protein LOZ80_05710 [Paenibacillus sp. HWE-109]|uniref:hypothetical protein n=1 Tax=Paenibacillus sp. HWE-109 TaxID=1306526 RepID=UPI001EDEE3FF|nr:hypothetical protein [Paenibacillus sp. HWE-109]UKS28432.1 hypothetical protein LOZ80_05710 [Paenibacillus sp. HWE-109]
MRRLIIYILLFPVLVSVALWGCENKDTSQQSIKTDIKPIMDRFPKLGEIQKCVWSAETIGKQGGIGPTNYRLMGYVELRNTEFRLFLSKYKWTHVASDWKPTMDSKYIGTKPYSWSFSDEFNNFIKSSNYVGKFYLDTDNGVIYFEVER